METSRIILRFSKPKYYVDYNKKTVVCNMSYELRIPNEFDTFLFCRGDVRGKAKCSDGDTFNEETGIQIAEAKAERMAYLEVRQIMVNERKQILKDINYMNKYLNSVNNFMDMSKKVIDHDREFVNELGKCND